MEEKLNWDDPIPDNYTRDWKQFCQDPLAMNDVKFKRCLMPEDAIDDPISPFLIVHAGRTLLSSVDSH